jgi:hypothetical protein
VQHWGLNAPSQLEHLERLFLKVLNKRNKKADTLLGRGIADRINIMHKARTKMLPRVDEIFPFKWMPLFGGLKRNYVPPPRILKLEETYA